MVKGEWRSATSRAAAPGTALPGDGPGTRPPSPHSNLDALPPGAVRGWAASALTQHCVSASYHLRPLRTYGNPFVSWTSSNALQCRTLLSTRFAGTCCTSVGTFSTAVHSSKTEVTPPPPLRVGKPGGQRVGERVGGAFYPTWRAASKFWRLAKNQAYYAVCCTQMFGFWQLRRISPTRWALRRLGRGGGGAEGRPQNSTLQGSQAEVPTKKELVLARTITAPHPLGDAPGARRCPILRPVWGVGGGGGWLGFFIFVAF